MKCGTESDGELSDFNLCGDAGCLAEPVQVERETVADIHCSRGETAQAQSLGDTGLRVEMRCENGRQFLGNGVELAASLPSQLGEKGEARGGASQRACDINPVTGAGAGAKQGFVAWDGAEEDDIGDGQRGLTEIATREGGVVGSGEGKQTVEEAVGPGFFVVVAHRTLPDEARR